MYGNEMHASDEFQFDVFLSYHHADSLRVLKLAEKLKAAGLRVWLDEWEISPGDDIYLALERGAQSSRTLVLCLTPHAIGSEWVALERSTALFRDPTNKYRRFIPLLLAPCDLPDTLRRYRYIDYTGESESAFKLLIETFKAPPQTERGTTAAQKASGKIAEGDSRMNVCMLSSEYAPHILGGLGVHVTQLTKELAELCDVDLILPHRSKGYILRDNEYESASPHLRINELSGVEANYNDSISWLRFAQHAYERMENLDPKPSVIHCHDWVTVLAGIKARWFLKIPLLFHVHLPNRTPLCSSVENLGLVCADLVTVNSQAMREEIKDRFPDKNVLIVPNGVDLETFVCGDSRADADRYVLFVGRLVEQKGVDYLLRSFVHVNKRFPNLELWVVGTGPCESAYRRLADCLLIGDKVQFLGWKTGGDLAELYRGAAVVAVPSVYEPFGMTALEAMACARPVVASSTGGLSDLVRDGKTGRLAHPRDHLDLAQWIIQLLEQKDRRDEMGQQGWKMLHDSDTYRWSGIARRYATYYRELSGKTLDMKAPSGAASFKDQIRTLVAQMERNASYICEDLFRW
jgi:glycosyltransferase involved in cell wall biosynthesis